MNIRRKLISIVSIKQLYGFFRGLNYLSLRAMNYGAANSPKDSGEEWLLRLINRSRDKQVVIFDVGANVGQYAQLAVEIFANNAVIHSFEPAGATFKRVNAKFEGVSNVKVKKLALGKEAGNSKIYFDAESSVTASLTDDGLKHKYEEIIEVSTIDLYCKTQKISIIDLLKIDTEGYELFVLEGAREMLSGSSIEVIQFEFGGMQIKNRHFLADFFSILSDYNLFLLAQNGLVPIKYSLSAEIFITTNYVAIRKDSNLNGMR